MASFLKKLGKVVGKGLQIASPILAATGVGAPLAIGAGALGGAMQGGKPKEWLTRAAVGGGTAALGAGAGKLAGMAGGASKLRGMASGAAGAGGGGGGGGWGGALSTLAELAPTAIGAYGAYQGAQAQRKQSNLDDRMLQTAEGEWAADAPLRARARELAMNPPQMPSGMYRNASNPFAR